MKKNNSTDVKLIINLIGGTTRFWFYFILAKIQNKQHPSKAFFINGPNRSTNYFGASQNAYRNTIATIVVLFVICSLLFKILRIL